MPPIAHGLWFFTLARVCFVTYVSLSLPRRRCRVCRFGLVMFVVFFFSHKEKSITHTVAPYVNKQCTASPPRPMISSQISTAYNEQDEGHQQARKRDERRQVRVHVALGFVGVPELVRNMWLCCWCQQRRRRRRWSHTKEGVVGGVEVLAEQEQAGAQHAKKERVVDVGVDLLLLLLLLLTWPGLLC